MHCPNCSGTFSFAVEGEQRLLVCPGLPDCPGLAPEDRDWLEGALFLAESAANLFHRQKCDGNHHDPGCDHASRILAKIRMMLEPKT